MGTNRRSQHGATRLAAFAILLGAVLLPAGVLHRLRGEEPVGGDVEPEVVAIQVGRIITVSGEEIEGGGTILIEGGRIRSVGKDVEVPWSARVYRFPRGVALPGMIDCHSTVGLRVPNENLADVPFISVLDGLDPSSPSIDNSLRDGVTVAHVIPGSATRLGGQGAVIRLAGRTVAEMVVRSPSAMKISLAPPRGQTRMESMAALRKKFVDLFGVLEKLAASGKPPAPLEGKPGSPMALDALLRAAPAWKSIAWEEIPEEKIPTEWRALADLVRGRMRAFIDCEQASDVFKAFELIESHGLDATLVLGSDAHELAPVLGGRKDLGAVVLSSQLETRERDPETGAELRHVAPRVLHDAGVRFALQARSSGASHRGPSFGSPGEDHLWYQAALLVRLGIPRAEALRAVTLTPAEILGLAHRMGSIEPGKDANIAVFSGDPLDARSWVELVLLEGREAYRRDLDRDLELLLKDPERPF